MKNLQKLAQDCMKELDALGIPYAVPTEFVVNTRAKSRWGQCRRSPYGDFSINISVRLLQDDVSDAAAKDTIIHELLHTVKGCLNHGPAWKRYADQVNRAYPQYHIKTSASSSEKGIAETAVPVAYKYKLGCDFCGTYKLYSRKTKAITYPHRFRCGRCNGRLYVEEVNR